MGPRVPVHPAWSTSDREDTEKQRDDQSEHPSNDEPACRALAIYKETVRHKTFLCVQLKVSATKGTQGIARQIASTSRTSRLGNLHLHFAGISAFTACLVKCGHDVRVGSSAVDQPIFILPTRDAGGNSCVLRPRRGAAIYVVAHHGDTLEGRRCLPAERDAVRPDISAQPHAPANHQHHACSQQNSDSDRFHALRYSFRLRRLLGVRPTGIILFPMYIGSPLSAQIRSMGDVEYKTEIPQIYQHRPLKTVAAALP